MPNVCYHRNNTYFFLFLSGASNRKVEYWFSWRIFKHIFRKGWNGFKWKRLSWNESNLIQHRRFLSRRSLISAVSAPNLLYFLALLITLFHDQLAEGWWNVSFHNILSAVHEMVTLSETVETCLFPTVIYIGGRGFFTPFNLLSLISSTECPIEVLLWGRGKKCLQGEMPTV